MRKGYSDKEMELVMDILLASEDTAPVEMSFGYVTKSGQCERGLVIKKCSQRILDVIKEKGGIATLDERGLFIIMLQSLVLTS